MDILSTGKLKCEYLEKLLGKIDIRDPRVVVGPGIGEDAAVLDNGDRYLIVKSDPITFVAERIGWYVVHINANDIAAMGGTPLWFLVTILLPEKKTTETLIENIMKDLRASCNELGVSLIGGHTEVTHGIYHPILSGTMLGEVKKGELIKNGDIYPGDLLYMTKGVAIEATSIIAREKKDEVIKVFGEDFYKRCIDFLQNPGISVVKEAILARKAVRVSGMHDPTEGGILSGAYEMALGSGVGLNIYTEKIPVYEETRKLCEYFNISPLGAVASGSLLISVHRGDEKLLEKAFSSSNSGLEVPSITRIGEFTDKGEPVCEIIGQKKRNIKPSGKDEITRIL